MRWVAASLLSLLVPLGGWAGSLGSPGSTLDSAAASQLIDTYYIFPDNQSLASLETADFDDGFPSPWGQLPPGQSDIESLANWVCTNRATYNIKAVIGVGDIVRRSEADEWAAFKAAYDILAACRMPYIPTYGNHDGDQGVNPQVPEELNDATLYHQNVGYDVVGMADWFTGSRAEWPDWVECITGFLEPDGTCTLDSYTENTAIYPSRSFWVPIPPLNIMAPEWEYSIKISQATYNGLSSPAMSWVKELKNRYPHDYWVHVTHAGPCDVPQNCDLIPRDLGAANGPMGGDWGSHIESLGPNVVSFINGHWGAGSAINCWSGGAAYSFVTRDDGSTVIAGGFDSNCGVRSDPAVALNCAQDGFGIDAPTSPCTNTPYTWTAWMQLKRTDGRKLCFNTLRTIDVDADDDGTPDAIPAVSLVPPELDRGTLYGVPTGTDGDLDTQARNCGARSVEWDSGPEANDMWDGTPANSPGCPNPPETCIDIQDLPET